jgi:LPS O-antigen subunit length determinant protein (WzzB/FepE family)
MNKIINIKYFWSFFKIAFIVIGVVLLLIAILFIVSKVLSSRYYKDIQ